MSAPAPEWNELHALFEQVEEYGLAVLALDGRVVSWNRGAQRMTLHPASEIVGQPSSRLYLEEDTAKGAPARDLELVVERGQLAVEGERVRADGTRFWATVNLTLLRDGAGSPHGVAMVMRDSSDERSAVEALRRSEERFRLLVEDVADYAIYLLDPQGRVTTWNAGAQKIKGYRAADILGRDFAVFFTDEERQSGRPHAELEIARQQGRFVEESWRVRADGSRFWASVVLTALNDASGQLVGYSKITRDLTERRRAEDTAAELREQQLARAIAEASEERAKRERERYRLLSRQLDVILEGVVDGITVQDRTGKIVFANSAAARLTGVASRDELVEQPPGGVLERFEVLDEHGFLVPPERLPGPRVLAGELQPSALVLVRDKQRGMQWWSQIRANAVLDEHGAPELAVNIWHDVSQQRRRDEHDRYLNEVAAALGKSLDYEVTLDSLVRLLVPGLCDWCAIHLLEGSQLRNVAVAHADPRKKKQAIEFQEKYPPNPDDTAGIWEVIRTGQPILHAHLPEGALEKNARSPEHLALLRATGIRSVVFVPIKVRERVSGTLSLIAGESGRRYDARDLALATELGRRVGAFIDNALLFQRAHEAARRAEEAARDAEAAGRLKDEFLATVSHELRTPLNAIMGWATMLRTRADAPTTAKGLEVIHRNAQAQSKLIEDILDVSRVITGKLRLELRTVDVAAVVSESLKAVRTTAIAREIRLELTQPPEPVTLVGDPERLQQVMWNLLSNAVKFTERGGQVRIKVERVASQVLVTVEDNGRGIEPDFLPHVFDRFKQADGSTTRQFGGLGLGLAIVRHIVELHGGRASVSSPGLGLGAKFEVTLPIQAPLPSEAPDRD